MGSENVDPRTRLPGSAGAGGIPLDAEGDSEGTGRVGADVHTGVGHFALMAWAAGPGRQIIGQASVRGRSCHCVWRTVEPRPREHL